MTKTLDSMVNEFETSLLKAMDEYQNVTRAIEAKDQAAIVRAGLRALKRSDMISKFAGAAELKSAAASNRFRREGNDLYRRRRFKEARDCYNKALAFAPNNSLEMKLAYSNTSAVLLATSSFKSCQLNIKTALEMNCPESLRIKLKKRLIEADKHVMEEIVQHIVMSSDEDLINFADFDVERNDEIPCVSTDVCVDDGKNVVAAKEIKSGTMVARERAYVSNQDKSTKYSSCYYCHKISSFFIPCEGNFFTFCYVLK